MFYSLHYAHYAIIPTVTMLGICWMNEGMNKYFLIREVYIYIQVLCLCQDTDYGLQELLVALYQQRDLYKWSDILITTSSSDRQMPLGYDDSGSHLWNDSTYIYILPT